ncbi:hypothetical protein OV208_15205 [Corallococcus sp. bb12-1]|uniref:hypothetical protein n=1 Tax=Corallococcus sp. bb12-1 TaxID=2996784 RepID=UPI002271A7B6|nr:hypothetical protein [Corallococcus sp. bb12-1]MCY1042672.1 hypothetical protein [Corallococcus sp. bb12-1]
MSIGDWYASKDEADWRSGASFASREEALAQGPEALDLAAGDTFWVGCALAPANELTAAALLDTVDNSISDGGCPDGCDAYAEGDSFRGIAVAVGAEAVAELEAAIDAWAKKHDVRPRWFVLEDVTQHEVPESAEEPAPR